MIFEHYIIVAAITMAILGYLILALMIYLPRPAHRRISFHVALKRAFQYIASVLVLALLFMLITVDWAELIPVSGWMPITMNGE